MKQIIAGVIVTIIVLLGAVYFIDSNGSSDEPATQRRAPQSESFNLN